MEDRIIIFDTTLRDGEQAPGASMTMSEKLQIAQQLAKLRVDVIEAGFPVSSPAQMEAVQRIIEEVDGPVICALARATEQDVEAAGESLANGENTRIHTFIATSDVHIEAKFGDSRYGDTLPEKRETILRLADKSVRQARTYTDNVEFSAEDAGRTDWAFLKEIVQTAIDAGATTINIPDTTGYCVPEEYAEMFREIIGAVDGAEEVIFSTHCHDDLGLAVANSLAGVQAGARQVECTINGIGERAGNAALEEIVMALDVRGSQFGVTTSINTQLLTETSKLVSLYSGFPVQPNKAVVGRNAFSHEAGIHQHGVLKSRETYEIMSAADVGQDESEQIRLGRHSGRHGLFNRLEELGFEVAEEDRDEIYHRFLELADQKKEIFEEDLQQMMRTPSANESLPFYELVNLEVSVGTEAGPNASVQIEHVRKGSVREASATGDGPVDAIYRAIDHAVEAAHDLANYSIQSMSEGADAQGEVSVLIDYGESTFAGTASSTDVLRASADAYIDALNRLAAHRADEESVKFVTDGIMEAFKGEKQ